MILELEELIKQRDTLQEELLYMTRFNDARHSTVSKDQQILLNQQEVILRSYVNVLNQRIKLEIGTYKHIGTIYI